MKREDFLNIEIFSTKDTTTRLAYVRPTKDKVFQKARQIIIKKAVPYGYILKQDFNVSDEKRNACQCSSKWNANRGI